MSQPVVGPNTVVSLHYTLRDDAGTVLDSSSGADPMVYLQGAGNIIPGLESRLVGLAVGASAKIDVPPAEGYGERNPTGIRTFPRAAFPPDVELQPGMRFATQDRNGNPMALWVTGIDGDQVTVDANHPLAGKTLHFDVSVIEVRAASAEEIAHQHPHGPDGHGHDHGHDHDHHGHDHDQHDHDHHDHDHDHKH